MSIEDTDREAAANATAPRVSLADMEHKIIGRYHFLASDAFEDDTPEVLSRLSICILVMENGFAVIGKSAPASPENFSSELGRKFAYEDAIRQLWVLEGYALRERLADA